MDSLIQLPKRRGIEIESLASTHLEQTEYNIL